METIKKFFKKITVAFGNSKGYTPMSFYLGELEHQSETAEILQSCRGAY